MRCASERVRGVNALRAYLNQSESRLRYAPFGLLPISTNCDVTSATLLHCWVNFSGRHSGGVSLRCITSLCLQVTLRLTTCKVNVRRGYYFAWFKRVDCIISYRVTCCHLINTHVLKLLTFQHIWFNLHRCWILLFHQNILCKQKDVPELVMKNSVSSGIACNATTSLRIENLKLNENADR